MSNEMKKGRPSVIKSSVNAETQVITFTVAGAGVDGAAGELHLDLNRLHEANRLRAVHHGLIQRVSDRAAMSRDTTNGKAATPREKLEAMAALVDHLNSGSPEWNLPRAEGGGRRSSLDSLVIAAVAEATGRSMDEVRDMVARGAEKKAVTPAAYLATLGGAGLVKPIVERMRAEQTSGLDVDADELLDEAMEGTGGD